MAGEATAAGSVIGRAIDWYSSALFVPPFLWLVRRWPLERATWPCRLPMYVGVTFAAEPTSSERSFM